MKRTKTIKKADAILMSDLHIRLDTPICRNEDEFLSAQWHKLQFIKDLQNKHDCVILCGGDVFHNWKPSPELLSKTIKYLPAQFKSIYGQHDLQNHSLLLQEKSGVFTLEKAGALEILSGTHWGQEPKEPSYTIDWFEGKVHEGLAHTHRKILVWHKMNYQGKKPWPGCTDPRASGLLRKYPEYNLILTGDNHKPFVEEHQGRILVNPGSMMRQSADQIDFKPRVYLYYAKTNTVEPVYLLIQEGVVSREHLDRNEERSDRIEAFISKLGGEWQAGMSFEANLKQFFSSNKVRESVKEKVYKAIEA